MSIPIQVTIDCADPDRLARFWAELLGYQLDSPPEGFDSWEAWLTEQGIPKSEWNSASAITDPDGRGARIFFQRVPEKKDQKNATSDDGEDDTPTGVAPEPSTTSPSQPSSTTMPPTTTTTTTVPAPAETTETSSPQ